MDVSQILPTPPVLPTPQAAAAVVEPSLPVAPTTSSSQGSSTDGSTSQQQSGSGSSSVDKALKSINDEMQAWDTQMQFTIDPSTHQIVVDIIDPQTGKTISTIPSETVLRIAKMITQFQGNAVKAAA